MLHSSGLAPSDVMQTATPAPPVSGGTVAINNTGMSGLTVINPAGTLATLTVNLPSDASSRVGQIERIAFLKSITLLTFAGAPSIIGAPTAAALGDNIGFQKVAANQWTRVI